MVFSLLLQGYSEDHEGELLYTRFTGGNSFLIKVKERVSCLKRLVIGILAHVDSGKTTLSEAMLYRAGEIRRLGRVDHKDAFLDTHTLERDRGITIFSKQALLRLKDTEITLLDTPGHIDFSAEMERTLQILDYAILVVSGADGVQSHTKTLWRLLERYGIATFIFLNKMDLPSPEPIKLLTTLKKELSEGCIDFSSTDSPDESFFEELALCDEQLLEMQLGAGINNDSIIKAISDRRVFPCFFGSALKTVGVDAFLSGFERYTTMPKAGGSFAANVFKITEDEQGNRLTHMKITGGSLRVRELIKGFYSDLENEWEEKVTQLKIYSGTKPQSVQEAFPGTVVAVAGLTHTFSGQGLGVALDGSSPILQPVLTYRLILPKEVEAHAIIGKLRQLEEEDPQLRVVWNEQLQEIHMCIMGEVQLEVLQSVIKERFNLAVSFGEGNILYKETILAPVEGVGHFEPLRHYAEVLLLLEPAPRGSGLHLSAACMDDKLSGNWQRLILTHLKEKNHLGVLTGSPITDMHITLIAGRGHLKHTEGGDFREATYRAVRQGLQMAKSVLLEPWYDFELSIPTSNVGRAMTDLQRMGARLSPFELTGEGTDGVVSGAAPVSLLRGYHTSVVEYTHGLGRLSATMRGYEPCHDPARVIKEIGYDSESDLLNSADSIFCAHGAGFPVKWHQVPSYMHIDRSINKLLHIEIKDEIKKTATPISRAATNGSSRSSLYDDKELMEIYEKTYGPINRDRRNMFVTPKDAADSDYYSKPIPIPTGPEYLLVDGYNILFAWDELKAIADEDINAARQELIKILSNYQGYRKCELILVFDAYKVKGNPGTVEQLDNISIVYTKEAETADLYIEKVAHKLAKDHRVRVATSDGLEQMIILSHGALRISATEFKVLVEDTLEAIRELIKFKGGTGYRIGDSVEL